MTLKKTAAAMVLAMMMLACGEKNAETGEQEARQRQMDSMALQVAVYPSEGCLPLYYAEQTGMFDSLKANIHLHHLPTMEDCDTALMRHHVQVSASDYARVICMRKDKFRATAIAQLPANLALYTAKGSRLNDVKQLKERIVALERHSESDYQSDKLVEQAKLERLAIFRTQFNNYKLREEMLTNRLIDAAFLDQPYATLAAERGAKLIWQRNGNEQGWTVLAMPTAIVKDAKRKEQVKMLLKIYDMAAKAMNDSTANQKPIEDILKTHYAIANADVDTLPSIRKAVCPSPVKGPKLETADVARQWLTTRGWIKPSIIIDSLVVDMVNQ